MNITLVLHNIRSTYNVGAILRTAEGLGVDCAVFSGVTPRYNDPSALPHLRDKLNHQIAKSALGAEKMVTIELVDNLSDWLQKQKTVGTAIVGLENNLHESEQPRRLVAGTDTADRIIDSWRDRNVVLLLGEEVNGIPIDLRGLMDYFLEFPMYGRKESFNVSVATGMALWELRRSITAAVSE